MCTCRGKMCKANLIRWVIMSVSHGQQLCIRLSESGNLSVSADDQDLFTAQSAICLGTSA